MKLHTNLTDVQVSNALYRAQRKGLVAPDVYFAVFTPERSNTHLRGFEVQLGTDNKHSLPAGYTDHNGKKLRVRRARNSSHGDARYAATWHEWGWFLAEVFKADPDSRWGQDPARAERPWGYSSPADFHAKTKDQFKEEEA